MSPATTVDVIADRVATLGRLLDVLRALRFGEAPLSAGRYHCLARLLEDPRFATSSVATASSGGALRPKLLGRAARLEPPERFGRLRALALLHWESAAEMPVEAGLSKRARICYDFANFLWRHLLTDAAFWRHFAETHDVADEHLAGVRAAVVEDILSHHLEQARACVQASDFAGARTHIEYLQRWQDRPPPLAGTSLRPGVTFSQELADRIHTKAERLVNGWVSEFLRRAAAQLTDRSAREKLPVDLSRDFPGALAIIDEALQIVPDNDRVLAIAVEHCNDYAYELANAGHLEDARRVIRKGTRLATRLAETHLRPGDVLNPQNKAVSLAFQLASQLETDATRTIACLEQCRRWGGHSERVESRIERQRACQALEAGRYDEALEMLDGIGTADPDDPELVHLRAACHFRRGVDTGDRASRVSSRIGASPARLLAALEANDGTDDETFQTVDELYRTALADLRRAAELAPEEETIRQRISRVETDRRLARDETVIGVANRVLEENQADYYEALIAPLEAVPADAEQRGQADTMRGALHFRLAVRAADAERFQEAESHLHVVLELAPDEQVVREQASHVYFAWGMSLVVQARQAIDPIKSSPEAFLAAQRNRFRSIMPRARQSYREARTKLQAALRLASADDRKQIADVLLRVRDPADDLSWQALVAVSRHVLEKGLSTYYDEFHGLLALCPSGHEAKETAERLAAAMDARRRERVRGGWRQSGV